MHSNNGTTIWISVRQESYGSISDKHAYFVIVHACENVNVFPLKIHVFLQKAKRLVNIVFSGS